MKKLFILPVIFALAFLGAGCGQKTGTVEPPSPAPSGSLEDILSKSERVPEMSYDLAMTGGGLPDSSAKIYISGTRIRQESEVQGQKTVMLGDTATALYMYYPEKNTATRIDLTQNEEAAQKNPYNQLKGYENDLAITGRETIDGKTCVIAETKVQAGEISASQKMWIWEQYGLPIKIVSTSGSETTTIEYKNMVIGHQSDALFELPAGVQVIDLNAMMQGNLDADALKALEGLGQ